jgi:DNA-binding IclR family transcriptional regulator
MHADDEQRQSAGTSRAGKGKQAVSGAPRPARLRPAPEPRLSRSLEYGIAILECFSSERQEIGIAELAELVHISRSTTHRYAITLVALGYLEQDPKRKYRLATRVAGPGMAAIGTIRREVHVRAVLVELREQTGHTVSMGVLDGARVIYVHRLLAHRSGQHAIDGDLGVGANVPVHCTALGKVMLASLPETDRRKLLAGVKLERHGPKTITSKRELTAELERIDPHGALVSDEELVAGGRSIAVLVARLGDKHPLAIDVTAPSSAYTVEQLAEQIGPLVEQAARVISGE